MILAPFLAGLAACTRTGPDAISQIEQRADSADQMMIGLRQYMTNQGVRQAYLESDSAFIYEASGRVDLKTVRVTFYTPEGVETSRLTSRTGFYNMRTGLMQALGNVVVTRTDGARLTTTLLRYDQARNEVSTDSAYAYDSADRHVTGQGFVSDPSFTNIVSQRVRGTAGRFTLPGQ